MANVLFRGVKKRYGDVEVISHLDLDVRAGEFMVLVGPSGCGKSTALRMIAGLEEITAGEIVIGDRVVNDLPPKDRNIAMVFQNYALYPHMTVRENMDFGLRMQKLDGAEIDRRVGEAARILGIDGLLQRKPRQLSGGQRQRVAVGRAIVRQPAVFLFDEPLSNLDATLRVQMRAEITALQRRLGTTTIYVTHDQVEAMTMGHRIAVLEDGDLQQVGAPLDVYAAPANVFVARFIGTPPMNFVPGTLSGDADRVAGDGFDLELVGPARAAAAGRGGARVFVGIRPEHLTDRPAVGDGPTGSVRVTVESVETLGHEILVHGRLGSDIVVAKVDPYQRPELSAEIELRFSCGNVRLFDATSGRGLSVEE